MSQPQKKINIFGAHFARIESSALKKLDEILEKECDIKEKDRKLPRTEWIKKQCFDQFSISLNSRDDIRLLDGKIKEHLYSDKSDWMREQVRKKIKDHKDV